MINLPSWKSLSRIWAHSPPAPPPDGGAGAYLTVLCVFFVHGSTIGMRYGGRHWFGRNVCTRRLRSYIFPIMMPIFEKEFNVSRARASLVGSAQVQSGGGGGGGGAQTLSLKQPVAACI